MNLKLGLDFGKERQAPPKARPLICRAPLPTPWTKGPNKAVRNRDTCFIGAQMPVLSSVVGIANSGILNGLPMSAEDQDEQTVTVWGAEDSKRAPSDMHQHAE